MGLANSVVKTKENQSSGGAEFNFRVEQSFYRNFAMIFGFDIGYSNLYFKDTIDGDYLTLSATTIYYGAVLGFAF